MEFNRDVDIVVGAQYGDEGKGTICSLLAERMRNAGNTYRWTARVGGQNAEHRFIYQGQPYCGRVLPSASVQQPINVLLGAGHCFRPDHLLKEAQDMGVPWGKLYIDGQAMWLQVRHRSSNQEASSARGTTGWGIGAATAEKVLRKPGTHLIRDDVALPRAIFIGSVAHVVYDIPGPGLFEGSQGALLSLDQGRYPYCTGKNVTVPAMCAELGISLKRVRRVVGVVRLVPMRVPGESGSTGGRETSYDALETLTGISIPKVKRMQGDMTKETEERVFEFSMSDLRHSHRLNGYDSIVITFADYHRPGNYLVRNWEDLHPATQRLINQIGKEIAPVILVRTGPGEYDNIWLEEVAL